MHRVGQDVRYVYTVSDAGTLIPNATRSIKSLRRFVDREAVLVFFTPPRSHYGFARLAKLAVVRSVENVSKGFVFIKERGLGRYGEKCHLCDVDSPTVVFLDADTLVKKDLSPLLDGDFEFSARRQFPTMEKSIQEIDEKKWLRILDTLRKGILPIPNAGFMIFRDSCHRKIKREWIEYISRDNLPNPCYYCNPKEQIALALALSGKKIRWMTAREHAFSWLDESRIDTFVLHKPPLLPGPMERRAYPFLSNLRRKVFHIH